MQLTALFAVLMAVTVAAAPVENRDTAPSSAAASGSASPSSAAASASASAPASSAPATNGSSSATPKTANPNHREFNLDDIEPVTEIQLGPRPYYLVDDMKPSDLKSKLKSCWNKKQKSNKLSVAHRGGGTLQFPEHSVQSNMAGVREGAGILECDVAFTADRQLVCRHSHCDLHTTTDILTIPELAAKCTKPFTAANGTAPASAKCCTSDITLAEYQGLCAKMDSFNATATTPQDYLGGILPWRTSLYNQCGTLLTHKEYIQMTSKLGLEFTPELKTPEVTMPFDGDYTMEKFAQQLIDDYKEANIPPEKVWLQSFRYADIMYWLHNEPEYAKQAMYLDENGDTPETFPGAVANLTQYKKDGVNWIAPPINYLLKTENGTIVPSEYSTKAQELGLGIVTWSLDRSGPLALVAKSKDFYYASFVDGVHRDGDIYVVVDTLIQKAGVKKMFSDWSATVTYYANCFDL